MKKLVFVFCFMFLFLGCDERPKKVPEEWETASMTYKCTKEQMDRVENEAFWCKNNTSYFSSYCYGSAFMRNCKKTEEVEKK